MKVDERRTFKVELIAKIGQASTDGAFALAQGWALLTKAIVRCTEAGAVSSMILT